VNKSGRRAASAPGSRSAASRVSAVRCRRRKPSGPSVAEAGRGDGARRGRARGEAWRHRRAAGVPAHDRRRGAGATSCNRSPTNSSRRWRRSGTRASARRRSSPATADQGRRRGGLASGLCSTPRGLAPGSLAAALLLKAERNEIDPRYVHAATIWARRASSVSSASDGAL
jgi:hypothetical protein